MCMFMIFDVFFRISFDLIYLVHLNDNEWFHIMRKWWKHVVYSLSFKIYFTIRYHMNHQEAWKSHRPGTKWRLSEPCELWMPLRGILLCYFPTSHLPSRDCTTGGCFASYNGIPRTSCEVRHKPTRPSNMEQFIFTRTYTYNICICIIT